jgi:hypothetical protein
MHPWTSRRCCVKKYLTKNSVNLLFFFCKNLDFCSQALPPLPNAMHTKNNGVNAAA